MNSDVTQLNIFIHVGECNKINGKEFLVLTKKYIKTKKKETKEGNEWKVSVESKI